MSIKLGIIGISEGNGHPYSWSAIMNGYAPNVSENFAYPVIPEYLNKQTYPKDFLSHLGMVSCIWTQDKDQSREIAQFAKIPSIVNHPEEMIGQVDAVLLARDDSENHYKNAIGFLEAGIPIFIDKPLALSVQEAEKLFNAQKYENQIFSCSALKYAKELQDVKKRISEFGEILHIDGIVANRWEKYAMHLIDPVLELITGNIKMLQVQSNDTGHYRKVDFKVGNASVSLNTTGLSKSPLEIRVIGSEKMETIQFKDTFFAFRESIRIFLSGVVNNEAMISRDRMMRSVSLLEMGIL